MLIDATNLLPCPCGWRGTMGECEVLGAAESLSLLCLAGI